MLGFLLNISKTTCGAAPLTISRNHFTTSFKFKRWPF